MISFGLACLVLFVIGVSPVYSSPNTVFGLNYRLKSNDPVHEGIIKNLSNAKARFFSIKTQIGTPNDNQPNSAHVQAILKQAEEASSVAQDKIKAFNQAIDELSKFANGSVAIEPKKTDPIPAPTPIRAETVTVFEFKNRLESSEKGKEGLIKSLDVAHTKLKEAEPKLSKPTERQPNFALAHEKLTDAETKLEVADTSKKELNDLLDSVNARAKSHGDAELNKTYLTPKETDQFNIAQGKIKDAINATTELVNLLDNKSAQQPVPTKPPVKTSNNPPVGSLTVADLKKALESTEPGNEGISTRLQKIKTTLDEAETTLHNFKEDKPGYNQAQTELKAARTAFNKADQLTKALNFTISTATYRAQSNHDDTLTRTLAEPDEVTQLRNAQSALTTATNAANGVKKLTDDMTTALVKDTPESLYDNPWMWIPIIAFIVLWGFFDLSFNGGKVYKLIRSMLSRGNTMSKKGYPKPSTDTAREISPNKFLKKSIIKINEKPSIIQANIDDLKSQIHNMKHDFDIFSKDKRGTFNHFSNKILGFDKKLQMLEEIVVPRLNGNTQAVNNPDQTEPSILYQLQTEVSELKKLNSDTNLAYEQLLSLYNDLADQVQQLQDSSIRMAEDTPVQTDRGEIAEPGLVSTAANPSQSIFLPDPYDPEKRKVIAKALVEILAEPCLGPLSASDLHKAISHKLRAIFGESPGHFRLYDWTLGKEVHNPHWFWLLFQYPAQPEPSHGLLFVAVEVPHSDLIRKYFKGGNDHQTVSKITEPAYVQLSKGALPVMLELGIIQTSAKA